MDESLISKKIKTYQKPHKIRKKVTYNLTFQEKGGIFCKIYPKISLTPFGFGADKTPICSNFSIISAALL